MVGRLLVALLVVASAAFVMLQQRETESTTIEASVADIKARDAAKHAAELDKQVAELKEQVSELEDKVLWQREHLNELAGDCTPTSPEHADVEVASLKRRAWGGDVMGLREPYQNGRTDMHFSALVRGVAATITRLRLYASLDDGTAVPGAAAACDTMDVGNAMLLGVVVNGHLLEDGFGPRQIAKRKGVLPLELVCDTEVAPHQPLTLEVLFAGGDVARTTIPAMAPTDQLSRLDGPDQPRPRSSRSSSSSPR